MIRVGVIGYGYWGPNIVRNFCAVDGFHVQTICDKNPESLHKVKKAYPSVHVTLDATEVLQSPEIDLVAVITPVWTHYELAKAALNNGKHVFVEKPFTYTSQQAEELVELADRKGLKIMVDHTFLFTGAVKKIRELVDNGSPHDLSIMDYIIQDSPEAIVATGESHLNGHEDVAFITLYFPRNIIAHVNVNWLSPVKVRTTLIGGEKKMLEWNDLDADEKIKIYDKGVSIQNRENLHQLLVSYRSGDMWAPQVEPVEALKAELIYFRECLTKNTTPLNDGAAGLRVVRMLEAAAESIRKRSGAVLLDNVACLAKPMAAAAIA